MHGESGFFNHVRPQIEIEAPHGYFAAVDPRSWRSVTVMEDVAATKGATFWSTTTKIDRGRIEDLLANMAVWHGAFWDKPALEAADLAEDPGRPHQDDRRPDRDGEAIPARGRAARSMSCQSESVDAWTTSIGAWARSVEISSRAPPHVSARRYPCR